MKINLLLLNGATAMALLGGFGLATPALAQDVNGPSMPSEEAVTRQLNRQAIDGTTQSPAVLNGEIAAQRSEPYYDQSYPRAPDDASSMPGSYGGGYDPAAPTYRDRQYDEQMRAYEDRQNQYRDQRDRYEREMDHYRFERYRYDWVPCYYNPYP